MSARPSARTCSAGSPTCCWPSRAIRRCCSISTTRRRWARTRSPASTAAAASTRTSRARSWSCIRSACAAATPRTTSSASPMCSPAGRLLPPGDNPEHGGEFTFNPRLHEPGAQKVLGKTYEDDGVEQGRAVLRDLAAHPATATHVATKLARSLHCRYAAACAGRADGEDVPRHRRRSQGGRQGDGLVAPKPGRSRRPSSSARASGSSAWCARPASRRPIPARYHRRTGTARRTAVASRLAQGLSRRRGILDRRHGTAARRRQQFRRARRGHGRSAGRHRDRAWHRPCRRR